MAQMGLLMVYREGVEICFQKLMEGIKDENRKE